MDVILMLVYTPRRDSFEDKKFWEELIRLSHLLEVLEPNLMKLK
jgi:hypothetical protein